MDINYQEHLRDAGSQRSVDSERFAANVCPQCGGADCGGHRPLRRCRHCRRISENRYRITTFCSKDCYDAFHSDTASQVRFAETGVLGRADEAALIAQADYAEEAQSRSYARMVRHDEIEAAHRERHQDERHGPWCECQQCHAAEYYFQDR